MKLQSIIAQNPQPAPQPAIPPAIYEWGVPSVLLFVVLQIAKSLIEKWFTRFENSINKQTEALSELAVEIKLLATTTREVAARAEETADEVAALKTAMTTTSTNGRKPE